MTAATWKVKNDAIANTGVGGYTADCVEGFRFPVSYSSNETPAAKAYQEPVYKEEAATLESWVRQKFDGSEGKNAILVVDEMMRWIQ